ncbi:MAG: hypothetical protein ACXWP0_03065 [Ktedonobacterales bacterium]
MSTDTTTAIFSQHEELCHVPHIWIAGHVAPTIHDGEAARLSIHTEQERHAPGLHPTTSKIIAPVAAGIIDIELIDVTEVVGIQLIQAAKPFLIHGCCLPELDWHQRRPSR